MPRPDVAREAMRSARPSAAASRDASSSTRSRSSLVLSIGPPPSSSRDSSTNKRSYSLDVGTRGNTEGIRNQLRGIGDSDDIATTRAVVCGGRGVEFGSTNFWNAAKYFSF